MKTAQKKNSLSLVLGAKSSNYLNKSNTLKRFWIYVKNILQLTLRVCDLGFKPTMILIETDFPYPQNN